MLRFVLPALLLTLAAAAAEVREWTTAEGGRTVEAEYVRSENGSVVIRRTADRRTFTLPLDSLSEADRTWVAEHLAALQVQDEEDNPFLKLITGDWERTEAHGMPFRLYGERKLRRPDEEGHPLVIFLHGRNGDVMTPERPGEAAFFSDDDNYRKRPCFIIAPQCPPDGSSWDRENAAAVLEIIADLTKALPINEDRIYLTGYSMGGYGTFHLLAQEPKLFAAGIPVASGGNPNSAGEFKKVPVWVFHGALDEDVKVSQSRDMVEALEDARGSVKYTEFADDGHGISHKVFADPAVHEWLFEQTR